MLAADGVFGRDKGRVPRVPGPVVEEATRASRRPSGSRSKRRSSSGEAREMVEDTPRALKWLRHQPMIPAGTENAVVEDSRAGPARRRLAYGKNVLSDPGRPVSSP